VNERKKRVIIVLTMYLVIAYGDATCVEYASISSLNGGWETIMILNICFDVMS
jgi:hypothetical protein